MTPYVVGAVTTTPPKTNTTMTANRTISTGNNESLSKGIYKQADGTFLALTFSASKTFKTLAGAQKWIARRA